MPEPPVLGARCRGLGGLIRSEDSGELQVPPTYRFLSAQMSGLTSRIEALAALDRASAVLRRAAPVLRRSTKVKDVLSGTFLGHPLHPVLTDLPIGCWAGAALLDVRAKDTKTASRALLGLGIVFAVPTALSGASDWLDTSDAEQRIGLVHAIGNAVGLSLMAISWVRRGDTEASASRGRVSMLVGLGAISFSGWLGGHLSYAMGVGVDTNAFDSGPEEWTAARPSGEHDSSGLASWVADSAAIVTIEEAGRLYAASNRCSHRGGPLSEGTRTGACVRCPWHGSEFDLRDGSVTEGPATYPQPVYEVRREGDAVYVRREEPRSLKRNPI